MPLRDTFVRRLLARPLPDTRQELERSRDLLEAAQRLAKVGSWELEIATTRLWTSQELRRIVGRPHEEIERLGYPGIISALVHPDDQQVVLSAIERAEECSRYEVRILRPDGSALLADVHVSVETDESGDPVLLRGTLQDVTEQRTAAEAQAVAQTNEEVAAREHEIADELQRSLLPQRAFDLRHLEVATYYRAGVANTQVGGDWYDVIELGESRTALVVGDVMGRGVAAAAIMGQIRAAVRAYARLGMPPAVLMECVDAIVRDIAPEQIVTCVYAVFDPSELVLRVANAGHVPPLVRNPDGTVVRVTSELHPPLGVGTPFAETSELALSPGAYVVLYTDGLVEQRGTDLESGIESLRHMVADLDLPLERMPEAVVRARLPGGFTDDDVAVLVARVPAEARVS